MIPAPPGSSAPIGLVDDAGVPGGGTREPVWIGPARRHAPRVAAAGSDSYSVVWAMPSECPIDAHRPVGAATPSRNPGRECHQSCHRRV